MKYNMDYKISKTTNKKISINSDEWNKANCAQISTKNWDEYPYCPKTEVRVLANDEGLCLRFETDETDLICEYKNLNDEVYLESCVEFFIKPDPDDDNYFNFELNAIGTLLLGFGTGRAPLRECLEIKDVSIFEIESQIKEQGFILKLFIPYSFLLSYVKKIGDCFFGNFQKCKEKGNNPHFITYYPINTQNPDFHRPEFFGKFIIEK